MEHLVRLRNGALDLQLDRLRSINALARKALIGHDKNVEDWYEEQQMVVDEDGLAEDRDYLEVLYAEQKADALEAYPQFFFVSLFASAYGVFEHYLNSVCKQAAQEQGRLNLEDVRGEGIHRARLYLVKVLGLTFPDSTTWRDLSDYGLLRNALLHSQGDLSENDKAPSIEQLAARAGTFQVSTDKTRIVMHKGFNEAFLDKVKGFSEELDEAWRKKSW